MKATFHTIEAIIGTLILLAGVMSIYPIEEKREFYFSDQGYDCLEYLDQQGLLRHYVYNSLNDELNNSLRSCLPPISGYTFEICSTMPCITSLPTDRSTFLSTYLIAGNNKGTPSYDPRIVNLWMWLK
jgi:hypothetical protein